MSKTFPTTEYPKALAASSIYPSTGIRSLDWRERISRNPEWFTVALIVFICVVVGTINPKFFQLASLFDIFHSATIVSIFAMGTLVVLASGGLDVSFTAIGALVMYTVTKVVLALWPEAPFAAVACMAATGGVGLGLINGLLVHKLKAPSLIVTIGTQYLFRGILLTFVGTLSIMNLPASMEWFGQTPLVVYTTEAGLRAVLPISVLALVASTLVTWFLLNRTMMGRGVYAIGASLPISERLGYNIRAIHLFVYGYAGLLAGLAGILHASTNRLANPFALIGTELDVIAAVILGGARITGGRGSVVGTLLGVVLVTLINSVLILIGVPSTWQKVIIGMCILIAGSLFVLSRRNAQRGSA